MDDSVGRIGVLYLGHKGGGAVVTEAFCRELASANYSFAMFLNTKNEILPKFKKINLDDSVVELGVPNSLLKALNPILFFRLMSAVKKNLQLRKIKLVLVPMHHPFTVLAIPFLKLFGIKVISGIHDFVPHKGDKKILIEMANFLIVLLSWKVFFFSSNQEKIALARYKFLHGRTFRVRLANDFLRSSSFVKPKKPTYDFIFFGRFESYKGIGRLCEAWQLVSHVIPEATLLIRGNGPTSTELSSLSRMQGVDCKIGYVDNKDVEEIMTNVKVILAPYDSATQSGITGVAGTFGMLAVTTPCVGFEEQAEYNPRILIAENFLASSFAEKMIYAKNVWEWDEMSRDLILSTGLIEKLKDLR